MKIHDISLTISNDLVTWPGDPKVDIQLPIQMKKGDPCNVSRWQIGAHTGTHTDAPFHFIDDGKGIDQVPLDLYIGPCLVVEVRPKTINIEAEDLKGIDLKGHSRVLFKTSNSRHWKNGNMQFDQDFISVGVTGADVLLKNKIKLVGVDYLSVESFHAPFEHPVHKKLLGAGMVVVEGLNLSSIKPGEYELICMPLKILHGDGTPVRAALREMPGSRSAGKPKKRAAKTKKRNTKLR
ncbi:MAG: cyclase family protein, partial [Bacteroidetes bacterium]|nr:cyclase family protein [Bacteroidota bacterium]